MRASQTSICSGAEPSRCSRFGPCQSARLVQQGRLAAVRMRPSSVRYGIAEWSGRRFRTWRRPLGGSSLVPGATVRPQNLTVYWLMNAASPCHSQSGVAVGRR